MSERMNGYLNRQSLERVRLSSERMAPGKLADFLKEVGIIASDREMEFIRSFPESIKEALRAVIISAVTRDNPIPVTVMWMPGYDYEVTISEAAGTPESIGGISVFVRTRYPADTHPTAEMPRSAT